MHSNQCERLVKHTHAHTICVGRDPDRLGSAACVFVHLCLCSSKIKTRAFSLIRPLSSSRVQRQNGAGTMTPRWRRLTPSPTLLTAPQNQPSPTLTPATPTPLAQTLPFPMKEPVRMDTTTPLPHHHPFSCMHTDTETNPPPYTAVIALGGTLLRIVDPPKKSSLSPSLCLVVLSPHSFLYRTDDTMWWFTPSSPLTYCRPSLLAHVRLARSVGLIASEVNKIGDKNQFEKRLGTQAAALRWSGAQNNVHGCVCVCARSHRRGSNIVCKSFLLFCHYVCIWQHKGTDKTETASCPEVCQDRLQSSLHWSHSLQLKKWQFTKYSYW